MHPHKEIIIVAESETPRLSFKSQKIVQGSEKNMSLSELRCFSEHLEALFTVSSVEGRATRFLHE